MDPATGAEPRKEAGQRLFFALWPDPSLQRRLHGLANTAVPSGAGKLVQQDNLHLTLVFLGWTNHDRRGCLETAADTIRTGSFSLTFDQVGYWRKPRVLWLGCSEQPAALLDLVAALQRSASACGFVPETRPYAVHLTVARKVTRDPGPLSIAPLEWPVRSFALVESHTYPEGARYLPLRTWSL